MNELGLFNLIGSSTICAENQSTVLYCRSEGAVFIHMLPIHVTGTLFFVLDKRVVGGLSAWLLMIHLLTVHAHMRQSVAPLSQFNFRLAPFLH